MPYSLLPILCVKSGYCELSSISTMTSFETSSLLIDEFDISVTKTKLSNRLSATVDAYCSVPLPKFTRAVFCSKNSHRVFPFCVYPQGLLPVDPFDLFNKRCCKESVMLGVPQNTV